MSGQDIAIIMQNSFVNICYYNNITEFSPVWRAAFQVLAHMSKYLFGNMNMPKNMAILLKAKPQMSFTVFNCKVCNFSESNN